MQNTTTNFGTRTGEVLSLGDLNSRSLEATDKTQESQRFLKSKKHGEEHGLIPVIPAAGSRGRKVCVQGRQGPPEDERRETVCLESTSTSPGSRDAWIPEAGQDPEAGQPPSLIYTLQVQ